MLSPEAVTELAGDLLRQLVPHIGNSEAVEAEIANWLGALGVPALSMVLLATVQRTFIECLTHPNQWPTDGIAFHTNQETPNDR